MGFKYVHGQVQHLPFPVCRKPQSYCVCQMKQLLELKFGEYLKFPGSMSLLDNIQEVVDL